MESYGKRSRIEVNQSTKDHLFSFVKAVAIHQGWAEEIVQPSGDDKIEEVNDDDENQENEIDDGEKDQKGERSESV